MKDLRISIFLSFCRCFNVRLSLRIVVFESVVGGLVILVFFRKFARNGDFRILVRILRFIDSEFVF